jgi:ectoine hydroxylase-related dioxygenase (phytanoyl-CoA dioxygenase family)
LAAVALIESQTKTPSIQTQVDRAGFAIISDLLPVGVVDGLIDRIHKIISEEETRSSYGLRNIHQLVPEVSELAESVVIQELVGPIIGRNAFLVRSLFFDKNAEANWKVAWHQDLTIAVRKKIETPEFSAWSVKDNVVHVQPPSRILENMITVRLSLDDCESSNGPVEVIPGSHKFGKLGAREIAHWRKTSVKVCTISRGGALLMRPMLLHASSAATVPRHRRVIHLEFAAEPLPGGLQWV